MSKLEFFLPGDYENPLTLSGRGRTVTAFHLAQGDADTLSKTIEMRRDVLTRLMSSSAVNYWLNAKNWLAKNRTVDKVQLLVLTSKGLITCRNSLAGGADVPTTKELVALWRDRMKNGAPGYEKVVFQQLYDEPPRLTDDAT